MSRQRRGPWFSTPGRLALLLTLPLAAAAGTAVLVSRYHLSPWVGFLLSFGVGLLVGVFTFSRALRSSLARLEALSDGVDGWRNGDFTLRLATAERNDEIGRLIELYNSMGQVLRRERNELRQRELLLRTVIETSPAAVVLVGSRGFVELANRQARELLAEGRRLRGTTWADLELPPELREALTGITDRLVILALPGGEEAFQVTHRHLELNARRHSLVMIHRITTELRRQEVDAWKKVLRVIAHELNNSLAPIRSVARTARGLLRRGSSEEQLDEALETIDESADRLHRFIDSYARFARLPAPRRERIETAALVSELRHLEPFALEGPVVAAELWADPAQLQQALLNLLRNAREAGSPPEEIALGVHDLGSEVRFDVVDRGPGIEADLLPRVLLPFFSTKAEGTGLGLALAREIVEAHGGRLHLESRTGGGLRVSCHLPKSAELEGLAIPAGPQASDSASTSASAPGPGPSTPK